MEGRIRKAEIGDIDEIVRLENAAFEADGFSRRQLAYLVSKARGAFYVATAEKNGGERVAGYISVLVSRRSGNARIYSIAVDPGFRSRGIARALMGKAAEYAASQGKRSLSLEVRQDNTAAIRFYKKCGFTISSSKPAYYADGTDGWKMTMINH